MKQFIFPLMFQQSIMKASRFWSWFFVLVPGLSLAQDSAVENVLAPPPPPPAEWKSDPTALEEDEGHELELIDMKDLRSFAVLKEAADNHRFIFTGEDHRVQTLNTVLETKLMRYLHTRGYNYYFIEAGKASEELVNRYILEGDTAAERILRNYFNPNFFRMFTWLKESNEDLDPEKKIHTVGLDIERNVPLALRLLKSMLPEDQAPDSLELFIESLKILTGIHEAKGSEADKFPPDVEDIFDFDKYKYQEVYDSPGQNRYFYFSAYRSVVEMTNEFRRKQDEFKAYLGSSYDAFESVIQELENWEVWIKYEDDEMPQSWVYRELYMETNFKKFLKEHPGAKGFGQFGRCHVTQITKVGDCGFAFFSSFNRRLITKIPELKDSVASIGVFYPGLENTGDFFDNGNIVDIMNKSPEGKATLYLGIDAYAEPDLSNKFTYVIIAKGDRAGKIRKRTSDGEVDYESTEDRVGIDFSVYQHLFDLSPLNNKVNSNFNTAVPWYEFGIHSRFDRLLIGFEYAFLPLQDENRGDTVLQQFKGFQFGYQFGYDLIKHRNVDLITSLGLGYQNMEYTEELTLQNGLLSNTVRTVYTNPAFVIDGRVKLGWSDTWFALYGMAGYRLDVSDPKWRIGEERVVDSPSIRWSGLMLGGGVRLSFGD